MSDPIPAPLDPFLASASAFVPTRPRTGIYGASKTQHAEKWRTLRASGVPIISTWIDEAGAGETSDWQDLWDRCIAEASGAAALILYCEPGEVLKGAYAELGAALLAGRPVFWVGPELASVARHRGVRIVGSMVEAVGLALEAVGRARGAGR